MPEHDDAEQVDNSDDNLDARIDHLARRIERKIQEIKQKDHPEFKPRSNRSRQLQQAYPEVVDEPRT